MPRPYQVACEQAVVKHWSGPSTKGAGVVMATGCGKTRTGLMIGANQFLEHGGRMVWLALRDELVTQPRDEQLRFWPKHGFRAGLVQQRRNACDARSVFASVQTLARPGRVEQIRRHGEIDLLVFDEFHHSVSPQCEAVIDALMGAGTKLLGLTATPARGDELDLGKRWEIPYAYSMVDAIRDGWLVAPWASVNVLPELDTAKYTGRLDFDEGESEGEDLLKKHVVENTVRLLEQEHRATRLPARDARGLLRARGRSVVVYTATIEQARLTAEALRAAGWRAAHGSGETPDAERKQIIHDAMSGRLDVVCNAGVWTEGTDVPRWDTVVLARSFQSWTLLVQCVGRGMRIYDPAWNTKEWGLCNALDPRYTGKRECLVIDLVGATDAHELVGAPVFLGAQACPDSPTKTHVMRRTPENHGACDYCDAKWSCWDAKGPHTYDKYAICTACGREQCPKGGGFHPWKREGHDRVCMACGITSPHPLSGLLKDRHDNGPVLRLPDDPASDAAGLLRVPVSPETWALNIDPHGILLIVGDRSTDLWQPWWAPVDGAAQPMTTTPVVGWHAWAVATDLVKRARRAHDAFRGREVYGGHATLDEIETTRRRAAHIAFRLGVAR